MQPDSPSQCFSSLKFWQSQLLSTMGFYLYALIFLYGSLVAGYRVDKFSLMMPNVRPTTPDAYLCTPVKVDPKKNYFITGFEPNASMKFAHHILVYGCKAPGAKTSVWNCGEMASASVGDEVHSPCAEGSQVIYAWAMDAPRLELPEGVGFKVGGKSPIQYLVLQIHYSSIEPFKDGAKDASGVNLHYTERPLDKVAGVILLGTGGMILPKKEEHMETSCQLKEDTTIYPFAFRTHTHALGKVVSGYRIRNDWQGESHWELLGKRDPQKPQMFYPTFSKEPILKNDILAARCTMVSNRTTITQIGSTKSDEMCNFYLMYYVKGGEPLKTKYCFSSGPPFYYWDNNRKINHIPDQSASDLNTLDSE